jgi:copper resistance protein C
MNGWERETGTAMRTRLGAVLLALCGTLVLTSAVFAHAAYLRSEPGAGAVVSAGPARVDIWFTQDLFRRQGENWIEVSGSDGSVAHVGEAQIDDDDRRHMWVALDGDLPAGAYSVRWRSLSAEDGDDEEGTFTFTLDPQTQVTSTPMSAASATPAVTATSPVVTPSTVPIQTPTPASGPCGAALLPAVGLLGVCFGRCRRRQVGP